MKQQFFNFDGCIEVAILFDSAVTALKYARDIIETMAQEADENSNYPTQIYINGAEVHTLYDEYMWGDAKCVADEIARDYTVLKYTGFKQ